VRGWPRSSPRSVSAFRAERRDRSLLGLVALAMLTESYTSPTLKIVVRIVATWRSSSPLTGISVPAAGGERAPGARDLPRPSSRSPLATESRLTMSSTVRTRKRAASGTGRRSRRRCPTRRSLLRRPGTRPAESAGLRRARRSPRARARLGRAGRRRSTTGVLRKTRPDSLPKLAIAPESLNSLPRRATSGHCPSRLTLSISRSTRADLRLTNRHQS